VNMASDWNTTLGDKLPKMLATVVGRPIHIFQVMDGVIKLFGVPSQNGDVAPPILLVRSFVEIGVDHYDLLIAVAQD